MPLKPVVPGPVGGIPGVDWHGIKAVFFVSGNATQCNLMQSIRASARTNAI